MYKDVVACESVCVSVRMIMHLEIVVTECEEAVAGVLFHSATNTLM